MITLLLTLAVAADPLLPPGADVRPAVYVDVTDEGFGQIETLLRAVLPESIPIDNAGLVQGGTFGSSFLGADYNFGVENLKVRPEIDSVLVDPEPGVCRFRPDGSTIPGNGYLDVDANLLVSLNSFNDPAYAYLDASISVLFFDFDILSEDCNLVIYRKPVTAGVDVTLGALQNPITCFYEGPAEADCPIELALIDPKNPQLGTFCPCRIPNVEIENFEWTLGIQSIDDLDLDCSGFISLIIDVADVFGIDPVEILVESLSPTIDGAVNDAIEEVVPQIEDALTALTLHEELDVLGNPIVVDLCPTTIQVDDRGLRLQLDGGVDAPPLPHPCIAAFDPGGSRVTVPIADPRYPDIGNTGVAFDEQVDALLNDDFINQALYGAWRSGLLCQRIDENALPAGTELPVDFDSSLLNLLSSNQFAEFFPTNRTVPLLIATRPEQPPIVRTITDGSALAVLEVEKLGLDLYAELDGRMARFVGLDLKAQAALDANFSGQTGVIGLLVDFDTESVTTEVVFNNLKPEASEAVATGFAAIFDTLAGPLINDLLGNLSFPLPSFQGLGVSAAVLEPAGPIGDFIGVFGNIGPVPYAGADLGGCDLFGGGGGAGGGCDLGCSTGAVPTRLVWLGLPMVLALGLRRRR